MPPEAQRRDWGRPLDFRAGRVDMTHGSGGRAMAQLIEELFVAALDNEWLRARNDQACVAVPCGRLAMATDAHVVSPLFFPGGDIGSLSVHGSINDVAMAGARPLYLSAAFVLEEGFPLADLRRIVRSMAQAARAAGISARMILVASSPVPSGREKSMRMISGCRFLAFSIPS